MARYILKRFLISIVTLLVIILVLFLMLEIMPGSPFNDEKLSEEQVAVLYQKYSLDQPIMVRFIKYVGNVCKGDFGVSYSLSENTPISSMLKRRVPVTFKIGLLSMVFGTATGLLLGLISAFMKNKIVDFIYNILTIIGIAVPSYLIAMFLSYYFGFKIPFLALLYDIRSPMYSSVIPIISMGFIVMAVVARFCKAEASDVMQSDYVLFAKCQGLSSSTIIVKYVLRNSLMPVITVIATLLVGVLTGSLVIEEMFSIPGIGNLLTRAIAANDYNVVIGLSFIYSALYIIVMFILDIVYCIIDPRVRLTSKEG